MALIDVYAPNRSYVGNVGAVGFVDGYAQADEEKHKRELDYFRAAGYRLEKASRDKDTPGSDDEQDVEIPGMPADNAKRSEFAAFAESHGIESEGLTIAQLRERIKAKFADAE